MEKDSTIIGLRKKLHTTLDFTSIEEVNHWDGDLCATGFQKGDRLIYISTFNYREHQPVKYYCEVEQIDSSGMKVSTLKSEEAVSFGKLVEIIWSTFDLPSF